MYTIGTGGVILIIVLLIFGYILGFAAGIYFFIKKLKELFSHEEYESIMDVIHADANKKED